MAGPILYEIQSRTDGSGVDLISDALPFGRLWYAKAEDAANYAQFYSRGKNIEIRFLNGKAEVTKERRVAVSFNEP